MRKIGKKLLSMTTAAAMVVGLFSVGGTKEYVKAAPAAYDSASAVNYATILGRATDFGIVANEFQHDNHMETTYAIKKYSNSGNVTDVDFITGTAQFIVAEVASGRIELGAKQTANTYNMEVSNTIYNTKDDNDRSFQYPIPTAGGSTQGTGVIGAFKIDYDFTAHNDQELLVNSIDDDTCSENIQRIIDNAKERSAEINEKATSAEYAVNYKDYLYDDNGHKWGSSEWQNPAHYYLDLRDSIYNNRVIYINMDSDIINMMRGGNVYVKKDPSSIICFNFPKTTEDIEIGRMYVSEDGSDNYVSSVTGSGGNTISENGFSNDVIDKAICQEIIYNNQTSGKISLNAVGGTILAPDPNSTIDVTGSSAGWAVAAGKMVNHAEWHYIYKGGSQDTLTDQIGQIHFAARKTFTKHYAEKSKVVEDKSVFTEPGDYNFNWYETDSGYNATAANLVDTVPNQATNTIKFPMLKFYTDEADANAASASKYYIPADTSKDYYYVIKEVDAGKKKSAVTNSTGYITIHLVVTNTSGKLKYTVSSKTYVPNEAGSGHIVYAQNNNVNMSGVEFSLGAFYNKIDDRGSLKLSKEVLGIDDKSIYSDQVFKVAIKNSSNKYIADKKGTLSDTIKYISIKAGETITIDNLSVGTYTLSEDATSAKITGYSLNSAVFDNSTVTISSDGDVKTAKVTNTYAKENDVATGTISLTKKAIGNPTDDTYTIYVKEVTSGNYVTSLNSGVLGEKTAFTIKNGGKLVFKNLPMEISGTSATAKYVIEEDDASKAGYDWTKKLMVSGAEVADSSVTLTSDETAGGWPVASKDAELQNSYVERKSKLTIKKVVEGYTGSETYKVYVKNKTTGTYVQDLNGTLGSAKTALTVPAGGQIVIDNLSVGPYTVTEDGDSARRNGYSLKITGEGDVEVPDSTAGGVLTITNTYTPQLTSVSVTAKKKLVDTDNNVIPMTAGQFTFRLKGTIGESAIDITATNAADGTIDFGNIAIPQGLADGTYTLDMSEVVDPSGEYELQNSWTKNQVQIFYYSGAATVKYNWSETGIEFVNKKSAESVTVDLTANKKLDDDLVTTAGAYSFQLVDESGKVVQTKTNDANGKITFDTLTFGKTGVYNYKVREVVGTDTSIEYDSVERAVVVTVTTEWDGTLGKNVLKVKTKVDGTETTDMTFVNKTKGTVVKKGRINVIKVKAGDAVTKTTFKVAIKRSDNKYITDTKGSLSDTETWLNITSGAPGLMITDLLVDGYTYTVEEDLTDANVAGYERSTGFSVAGGNVTLEDSKTSVVTITNNYTKQIGKIEVTKTLTGVKAGVNPEFSFSVYDGSKYYAEDGTASDQKVLITIKGGETRTINNLPFGTYTVAEETGAGYTDISDHTMLPSSKTSVSGIVIDTIGQTKTAALVNNYSIDTGSLTLKKTVDKTNAASLPVDGTKKFKIAVKNADGNYINDTNGAVGDTTPRYFEVTTATPITINNLPVGSYTIEEDAASAAVTDYTLEDVTGLGSVSVTKSTTPAEANVTNKYKTPKKASGTLVVTKAKHTDSDEIPDAETFPIKIKLDKSGSFNVNGKMVEFTANEYKTFNLKVGDTLTINELWTDITYTVEEENKKNYSGSIAYSNSTHKVAADNTDTVTVTNKYDKPQGKISVTKAIEGVPNTDPAYTAKTFAFTVKKDSAYYDEMGKEYTTPQNISIKAGETKNIENLPIGIYIITEVGEDTDLAITGYKILATSVKSGTAAINAKTDTKTVTLTNKYEKIVEKIGSLIITKTIKGDVTKEEAEGALRFEVTKSGEAPVTYTLNNFDSYDASTKTWTMTLGAGKYTVKESIYSVTGYELVSATYKVGTGESKDATSNTASVDAKEETVAVAFEDNYTKIIDKGNLVI